MVAVQALARGGRVATLDRKGSHRWALGLAGGRLFTRPAQMHEALARLDVLPNERTTSHCTSRKTGIPVPGRLVIAEELTATIGQLVNFWTDVRGNGDPEAIPLPCRLWPTCCSWVAVPRSTCWPSRRY